MQFSNLLIAMAATGASAAAVLKERIDAHIVDFRTYGAPGCRAENQGIWTFTQSQLTGCMSFASFGEQSVEAGLLIDITPGCTCKSSLLPSPSVVLIC